MTAALVVLFAAAMASLAPSLGIGAHLVTVALVAAMLSSGRVVCKALRSRRGSVPGLRCRLSAAVPRVAGCRSGRTRRALADRGRRGRCRAARLANWPRSCNGDPRQGWDYWSRASPLSGAPTFSRGSSISAPPANSISGWISWCMPARSRSLVLKRPSGVGWR